MTTDGAARSPAAVRSAPPDTVASERRWAWLAGALMLVLWFALLGQRSLWDPDEGRYAEIAREMVASGDWITPRLNGLLYFEKPPLHYWATATAFSWFGAGQGTARLWSSLTGLLCIALVWAAGHRLHSPRAGVYGALVTASALLYFLVAHLNTLDMGLTLFMSATVLAAAMAWRPGVSVRDERVCIHVAWAAAGLAVLSKGLVGVVLPGAMLIVYSALYRDLTPWRRLAPLTGVALFLLVTAPWFVAVSLANADFAWFFFVHEHFLRFVTTTHQRHQPWWYFGPVLLLGLMPWTVPVLAAVVHALRQPRVHHGVGGLRGPRDGVHVGGLLVVWCAVVFLFFSASGSKLLSYIVPIFPALGLLTGAYLAAAARPAFARQLVASAVVVAALLAATPFLLYLGEAAGPDLGAARARWLVAAGAALLAGLLGAWWLDGRLQRRMAAVAVLSLAGAASFQAVLVGFDQLAPIRSAALLAAQIRPELRADTRVYVLRNYPQSLPFYLGRTVTVVDWVGELAFGLERDPARGIPTLAAFAERWRAEGDAIAVMSPELQRELAAQGLPMRVIGNDAKRVAVARQ